MSKLYTSEQFWQTYETLPEDIQNALWEPKTGENIAQVIEKNELEEHHESIVDLCGAVFLGLILPQDLLGELKKLTIPADKATTAAKQLNSLVFYPIKPGLEELHRQVGERGIIKEKTRLTAPRHSPAKRSEYAPEPEPEEKREVFSQDQEQKEDAYRESIE
jgi:hypothetical protein